MRKFTLLSLMTLGALAAGPVMGPPVPNAAPAVPAAAPTVVAAYDAYGYLRAVAAKRSADPVGPIADRMATIAGQLGELRTDAPVQERERAVTADLDVVIQALEKQCKGGTGPGSANPSKPAQRSQITKGPGGQGPLHDAASGTKSWAQLPAKERGQITQSQTEGFPPGYEQVLAGYYSRLSQEQVSSGETAAPAGPATRPAGR